MTDADRWRRVSDLLADVLERPPAERAAYLAERTAGDPDLREEVASLVQAAESDRGRLDQPAMAALNGGTSHPGAGSLVGRRVGIYQIERQVAHGGMGAVYEAVRADGQFRQRVAIKTIWRGTDSEVIVRRFRQERQILAGLAHPNIAVLIDGGVTDDGTPFLAMEFVDGVPIDGYCRARNLDVRERIVLMRQVCTAVQYAHRQLVVHRDIKPGNILVTADGTVKLVDFGIAKLIGPEFQSGDTLSRAGIHPFTAAYASPEQLRGDAISTATDVYSLGVVLYQLLSGRSPFGDAGTSPSTLFELICESQPPLPSRACTQETSSGAGLPPPDRMRRVLEGELDAIVMMALRKEPERRYASVEALSEDLRRYLEQRPVLARPDTAWYRLAKFARRNGPAVGLGAMAATAVIAGTVISLWQGRVARIERDRARLESQKTSQVAAFLQGILGAGDFTWASTTRIAVPNPTVAQALDSAAQRLTREPNIDPLIQAALYRTIGRAYAALRRSDLATLHLDSAQAIHERHYGPDHVEVAIDLYLGTWARNFTGDSAGTRIRKALEIVERHRPDTVWHYLPMMHDLAYSLSSQGRQTEAESLYALVIERERQRPDPRKPLLAMAHSSLGFARWNEGRSAEAIDLMTRGVAYFDSLPSGDLDEHAAAMFTLATALVSTGRAAEAVPYLERTRPLLIRVHGPDAPVLMQVGISFADALAAAGDTARSESEARTALELGERLPPGNEGVRFQAEWTWARQLRRQGRFVEAERIARQQYRHARQSVTSIPYFWADATFMLGAVLVDLKRWREAEPYLLDSWRTAHDQLGAQHVRALRVLPGLAMLYRETGRAVESERYRALMPDSMRARLDSPGDR